MGRPPLTPDQHAAVALHARSGVQAVNIALGQSTESAAVAELALTAPGRPDLIDQVADVIRHPRIRHRWRTGRLVRHGWRCLSAPAVSQSGTCRWSARTGCTSSR
jgi:hypothetical protein